MSSCDAKPQRALRRRFLAERSFYARSLSDEIREELSRAGLEETRERMIEAGNAIRAAEGPGALAARL